MNNIDSHLLREYKKVGLIKVTRFASGMYNVTMKNGNRYHIEDAYMAECGYRGEWIVRVGHVLESQVKEDNYYGHYNSLLEAQFELVQNN